MATLYPVQDVFTRGEISPRLHARGSLDLYRAALSKCENFVTLPHGGIRKRGGSYFVGEVKNSAVRTRAVPFIFSADQAYCLEFGNLYIRVYAYGARVGTVEVASPYLEADLFDLAYVQSADQMWISHKDYPLKVLTRTAHTTWTLEDYPFEDGPYDDINDTSTTLTPADHGSLTPQMTSNTAPSGTVSGFGGSGSAWQVFDKDVGTGVGSGGTTGSVQYRLPGGAQAIVENYYLTAITAGGLDKIPVSWKLEGSNNGSSWTTLDSQTGQGGWTAGETRYYEFFNKSPFEYHRLSWTGVNGAVDSSFAELTMNKAAASQAPFNLTASSTTGINNNTGFQTSDVGRAIRLLGSDGRWRWAKIMARTSTTVVTIQLYGFALPDLSPITRWRLGTFVPGRYVESGSL